MIISDKELVKVSENLRKPIKSVVFEKLVREALRLTDGSYASFFLLQDNTLVRAFTSHKTLHLSNKPRLNGRTIKALHTKKPYTSDQLEGTNGSELFKQLKISTILYIPIIVHQQPIGVINVLFTKPFFLSKESQRILATFGEYAGLAFSQNYIIAKKEKIN